MDTLPHYYLPLQLLDLARRDLGLWMCSSSGISSDTSNQKTPTAETLGSSSTVQLCWPRCQAVTLTGLAVRHHVPLPQA